MSMISEEVDALWLVARAAKIEGCVLYAEIMEAAANTIEEQGEKIHALNMERSSAHYNNGWIPCEDRLPEEHDSMFAKFKGTDKWHEGMFEKTSDDVNVTVAFEDGTRKTMTMHTTDGKWRNDLKWIKHDVTAWRPLPEPYKEEKG